MTRFAVAVAVLVAALAVRAEDPATVRTAQLLGIEEYRMANGLRVVLYPDSTQPKITVNLTVLVGSVNEGAGEMGMAHVFEHVLFHSVEGFPDISASLKELGANYNGTTSFDRTNFFETFNASHENLETAIRLESGRLGRAVMKPDDLEREGKIVESEFDMGASNPQRTVIMRMFGAMYDFHAYSREPIGTIEDFKSLKVENIKVFYKKYYRPDNAVLFVTGKFDTADVLGLITKHFGPLPGGTEGRPNYTTREPASTGERRFSVRKPGEASVVIAGWRVPGAAHQDSAVADVFSQMLASGKSGPLYEAIVGKGLAANVGCGSFTLRYASPLFVLATVPKDKDAELVEVAILDILEKKAASLTDDDLERAQSVMEKDFDDLFNNAQSLSMALSEAESWGSWKLLLARREQTKGVTLEAIKAFAAKYIRLENRVVGRFIPDDKAAAVQVEPEPDVNVYDPILAKMPATLHQAKGFDYVSANVQAALKWSDVGPAKIGIIRKETNGDHVHVHLFMPLAGRKEVFPKATAGDALAALMTERTKTLSKDELSKKLADLKSEISVTIAIDGANVSITTTKQSFAEAMKIAQEMLRTPVIEEAALKEFVQSTTDQIKSTLDEPQVIFQREMPKMLLPEGDPRRGLSPEQEMAELGKLTVESVLAFHKEFMGATGMIGGIVGDVDAKDVEAQLLPIVADWKAARPGVFEPTLAVDKLQSAEAHAETPGKPSAFTVLLQPIHLSVLSPDYIAIQAAASALFQDMLASRIPKKVRGEKALSYSTGGSVVADLRGDFGMVVLYTMTKPENASKALELIRSELAEALKSGITEEELAAFKKSYGNQVSEGRANDGRLAGTIVTFKLAGQDFTLWKTLDDASASLTTEAVNAALRKYIDPAKMGLIQVGDFEGAKTKKDKKEHEKDGDK
ncbi:MAG: insulinase family protein [Planctomycetes bacterium]|nr:insulinase family protein [Planctomycetota bacterium]